MSKFKVGQVWRSREGLDWVITRINVEDSRYPITAEDSCGYKETFGPNGTLWSTGTPESACDLIGLVMESSDAEPTLEIGVATPVAYMWSYYQNDSIEVSGVTLTLEFAEEVLKNDKPFGYTGTITPLYAGEEETYQ